MSLSRLMTQPLTVQAMGPTSLDPYGTAIPGPLGAPVAVSGYLEQLSSVEFLLNRDTTVTKWEAWLPTMRWDSGSQTWVPLVVTPLSVINYMAQVFQVDGAPWNVFNPRTRAVSHIQCKLIVVTG